METKLRILHLEDDPDYAELVRAMLETDGLSLELVCARERSGFITALEQQEFDLIISDYCLPSCSGLEALRLAQEKAPGIPFILVSGTIGEQAAIESLKHGATDYVLKQWLDRLVPTVRRALREAEDRRRSRQAEQELVRREAYFRALTENALDVLGILDRDGVFQYHSASVKRVLGYEPSELSGLCAFELVHPEDMPAVRQAFAYGLDHPNVPVALQYRYRHKDGTWRYLDMVGKNLLEDPIIAGVVVTSRDVTERKLAEQQAEVLARLGRGLSAATTREAAARVIQESADALFGWDAFALSLYSCASDEVAPVLMVDTIGDQRVELARPGATHQPGPLLRRVLEHGAELILRDKPDTMLTEAKPFGDESRPSASLMFAPIRHGEQALGVLSVQSYRLKAYTPRNLETLQVLADHCGGALERLHAEEALREAERRFRGLFESSPDAIFVEDFTGQVLDVNPTACRLHGMTREQLVGQNVLELVPAEKRGETSAGFQAMVNGEVRQVEGFSVRSDGERVPVEVRANRVEYAGQPALLLHVRDLSERKRAESALRGSELLFHSVWENSVDGMCLSDEEGVVIAVNDAFCKLVALRRDQLEGQRYTAIYAATENPARLLQQYRERFRERVVERHVQRRLTLHNGTKVESEDTNSFVEAPGRPPLLLTLLRDITAQKRLEDQLRQSQKLEAIGQLAGGVAHDFNNILTVIQGHVSLLNTVGNLTGPAAKSAQQIAQAADRAAGLTRQLLTFSRRRVIQPRRVDLNDVVNNLTKMVGRLLGEDIALQLSYWPEPATVLADASMMEQVILNLAVNARDAMPKGGQLAMRVGVVSVNEGYVARHAEARPGRFVCLAVTDTGCGIPPENLRRIFEPFFTTKEVGKGTGLGLATVYGIVQQHQGWIEVESEVGRGTAFRIYLPFEAEVAAPPETKAAQPPVRGGDETILVVEDEADVRELVSSVLECYGYRVLAADSGPQALKVWREHQRDINLVLTDLVMPGRMSGWELAEQLWDERPDLPVIFTSGYSNEVAGHEFVSTGDRHYLQKPYQPQKLARRIREVLDQPPVTLCAH